MGSPSFLNLATRLTLYLASLVRSVGSLGTNCSNGTRSRGTAQGVAAGSVLGRAEGCTAGAGH